ncbi:hypothetical protein A6J63_005085 [Yersinia enterocolitica]|nr:hypothetical protein A6J65_016745 [Yersinia enterocolitica]PNM22245.1 hypothetical protein A6J63_005085 [Yersinia enterocolitica]HDL7838950.1 hypothetical protein [Yersinia enterocolitica]
MLSTIRNITDKDGGPSEPPWTNLPGADLNAACSGPEGVSPMDGTANSSNISRKRGIAQGATLMAPLPVGSSQVKSTQVL